MAATYTIIKKTVAGAQRHVIGTVTLGTYATNGVAYVPRTDFSIGTVDILHIFPAGGYTPETDYTGLKVKVFRFGAVSGHTHDMKYIGGIAATEPVVIATGDTLGKNAATDRTIAGSAVATKGGVMTDGAIAAGPLTEVSNGIDISAVTFRFWAIGV